jgi:hypothetical protein
VGLERGPPSLVSATEELLGRKSSGSGLPVRKSSSQTKNCLAFPQSLPTSAGWESAMSFNSFSESLSTLDVIERSCLKISSHLHVNPLEYKVRCVRACVRACVLRQCVAYICPRLRETFGSTSPHEVRPPQTQIYSSEAVDNMETAVQEAGAIFQNTGGAGGSRKERPPAHAQR